MIDRKTLRADARDAIRQAKPSPVLVTLAVAAILAVLIFLTMQLNGSFSLYRTLYLEITQGDLLAQLAQGQTPAVLNGSEDDLSLFATVLVLALELMTTVISVGYTLYCLRISRRMEAGFWNVFDAFGIFLRAVVLRILKGVVLFLWLMLFSLVLVVLLSVVSTGLALQAGATSAEEVAAYLSSPWTVAVITVLMNIFLWIVSYFYRLADYFMLDHPELTCAQCLSMSRLAMRGRKKQLFLLDLSFLGWYLLSVIPFVALWVQPYTAVTFAGFYREAAPAFWSDMEQRLQERAQRAQQPPQSDHGYSVPGQKQEEDDGDDDIFG